MESGLCRNLLEPRAQQPNFMHKPMGKGESMWPLVLGTIFLFFAMLVAAFLAGRQSVYLGCCSCLSRCCGRLAPQAWSPHGGPHELRREPLRCGESVLGAVERDPHFAEMTARGWGEARSYEYGHIAVIDDCSASAKPRSTQLPSFTLCTMSRRVVYLARPRLYFSVRQAAVQVHRHSSSR